MRALVAGVALALGLTGYALANDGAAAAALPEPGLAYERGVLALLVNGEKRGEHFALMRDGDVYLEKALLDALGFADGGNGVVVDGTEYSSLASRRPGITFDLDDRTFQLRLTAGPAQFKRHQLRLRGEAPKGLRRPDDASAFINYDLQLQHDRRLERQSVSLPHEMGVRFHDLLLFSSCSYSRPMLATGDGRYIRLYTYAVKDDPERMVRYTLGDVTASSGALGGGAVVGGFSVTRNFGANPFFIRTSGLSVTGAVETSSEVEVYRNGVLLTKRSLAPGFFDLQDMPLQDGSGEVTLVIKDAFGRESRVDMPYTASQELLRKGVHDFGYTVGLQRRGLGSASSSYGEAAGLMRHKVGLTDFLTLGVSGEASRDVRNAGLSFTATVPRLGTLGAAAATSRGEASNLPGAWSGNSWRVSLTNGFPLAGLFYTAAYSRSTPGYSHLSLEPFANRPLRDLSGAIGLGGNRLGSFSFYGSLREASIDGSTRSILGMRYSVPLFKWATLAVNVSQSKGPGQAEWAAGLTVSSYLGKGGMASVAAQRNGSTDSLNASLQKVPKNDQGLGYRLAGRLTDRQPGAAEGELSWNGAHGLYSARYQSLQETEVYGVRTAGSIATLFDGLHFGRPVYDSFAVVKVDNLKDVPVYQGGRLVGTTDARGEVFAPSVSSYGINPFTVRQQDLPLNYTAASLEEPVLPSWRSGSRIVFDVDKVQAIRGVFDAVEEGKRKPASFWVLTLKVNGKDEVAPLMQDGEFYMEGIPAGSYRAEVATGKKRCSFRLEVPESDAPVVNVGRLTCNIQQSSAR